MTHWKRLRRHGDVNRGRQKKEPQICSVSGCGKKVEARGWCQTHYVRWKVRGDPLFTPYRTDCSVPGCTRPHAKNGLCDLHNGRMKRTGTTDQPMRLIDPKRYRVRTRPEHPVAMVNGRVYLHRAALYDAIGPGKHSCHWCGRLVSWDRTYPWHADALLADHIDGDRHNNEPPNLVPSCNGCNAGRTRLARRSRHVKYRDGAPVGS